MPPTEAPILFHYAASIYSHRVLWYLWLRNILYDECIQSPVMPRHDLSSIGVGYRKIPLSAIGKDIYTATAGLSYRSSKLCIQTAMSYLERRSRRAFGSCLRTTLSTAVSLPTL
jgi:hypothetical protein